ncbi:hypothetical protein [Saccharopolyspora sp. CA-218241]|uniref:hypothetical protein n=1 Tax=Saccharopolyspora sp. CA-218241 TaxID=3240027 RepID=UPI003D96B061
MSRFSAALFIAGLGISAVYLSAHALGRWLDEPLAPDDTRPRPDPAPGRTRRPPHPNGT